jgi:signal transduction histidine kinase
MFRDREELVIGAAILGTGFSVLTLANSTGWGWLVGLLILPALIVRARWHSMPGWLLLLWVGVPVVAGEASGGTKSAYLVLFVAVVVVAAHRPRRFEHVLIAVFMCSPLAIWLFADAHWYNAVGASIWFGGLLTGWALGNAIGCQWELIDELEATQQQLADAAVTAERQRIAGELHDVVGHSFSVVLLHLSGARLALESGADPTEAAAALRQAEDVGRRGMDELREVLQLMRDGSESLVPIDAGDISLLIDRYCDAGMRLDVDVVGDPCAASTGCTLVLHDVVREALTNVAKHAPTPEAAVRIRIQEGGVQVRVDSALPVPVPAVVTPPPAPRDGLGLAGLEQRVAAIGGSFSAAPEGERWVVEADLPGRLTGAPA